METYDTTDPDQALRVSVEPTIAEEALAALTLLRALRAWADGLEPQLIDMARDAGAS